MDFDLIWFCYKHSCHHLLAVKSNNTRSCARQNRIHQVSLQLYSFRAFTQVLLKHGCIILYVQPMLFDVTNNTTGFVAFNVTAYFRFFFSTERIACTLLPQSRGSDRFCEPSVNTKKKRASHRSREIKLIHLAKPQRIKHEVAREVVLLRFCGRKREDVKGKRSWGVKTNEVELEVPGRRGVVEKQ